MDPVGFVIDSNGNRILALVPVAQRQSRQPRPATDRERSALAALLLRPGASLELPIPLNPIRAAREAAGITQADLAFALRISQPMLSRQERPFRRTRPGSIARALDAIRCIVENRNRPEVPLEAVLASYGTRLAASAARKPRDPVERRLLREAGDPAALAESDAPVREGGARRLPVRRKPK